MDNEPLPYRGFFSSNRSTDIVSKVVFNIFLFVGIVVCVSWLNSLKIRSQCKQQFKALSEPNTGALISLNSVGKLASLRSEFSEHTNFVSFIDSRVVVIVSKWVMIEKLCDNLDLRRYFSKCPPSVSSQWRGLVFSDSFTRDYSRLDDLFEFTLQSLPAKFFMEASRRGLRGFFAPIAQEVTLSYDSVHQLVSYLLFEAVMVSSSLPHLPGEIQQNILDRLDELSQSIMELHDTGKLKKDGSICRNLDEFAKEVEKLLEPLLLFELAPVVKKSETLLSHLLLARKSLSEKYLNQHDGDELAPLTSKTLSHFLFEVLLIGQYALTPCLRTIIAALTLRSDWRKKLVAEISDHLRNCSHKCRRHSSILMEKCMDLDSKCLSFTKSVCLESVRFSVAGWPLGALREAFRDGDGFFAGDIILLNEPAVFHDTALWFRRDFPHLAKSIKLIQFPFDPVGRHGTKTANYLAHRVLLDSRVCFMRRDFIFRLLFATTIELFSQYSVKPDQVQENSEFSELPLYLPLDPSLMCDTVLLKQDGKDS